MRKARRGVPGRPKRRHYRRHEAKTLMRQTGSNKHRNKHLANKQAKAQAARDRRNAAVMEHVRAALLAANSSAPMPTSLDALGGAVPVQGWGTAGELSWYFRFRGDWAYLEVGHPGQYAIEECLWLASRGDVTGDPWCGWLSEDETKKLLTELWLELAPPKPGQRHRERLTAAVDAMTAGYDDDAVQIGRRIDGLDLVTEFKELGRSYVELDDDGQVVRRDP